MVKLMKKIIIMLVVLFITLGISIMVIARNLNHYAMYYTVQKYGKSDYYNILNTDLRNTATTSLLTSPNFKLGDVGFMDPVKDLTYTFPQQKNLRNVTSMSISADTSYYQDHGIDVFYYSKNSEWYTFNVYSDNSGSQPEYVDDKVSKNETKIAYQLFKTYTDKYIQEQLDYVGTPPKWCNLQWIFNRLN